MSVLDIKKLNSVNKVYKITNLHS